MGDVKIRSHATASKIELDDLQIDSTRLDSTRLDSTRESTHTELV
jgi:hypothetical protein